jgi:REP element-mobilizing transposase RayT
LLAHVIFSTKDREPLIEPEMGRRLFAYMGGVVPEMKGSALIMNGVVDHVHLLVNLPAKVALADLMRVVKANSSRWVHEELRRPFAWQTGYGAFSVSQSNVDEVTQYIAGQEAHHRRLTFQEEFVAFLKRHGIAYDEKYIWE